MNFMKCTTCKAVVQVNDTGICLGCQQGFCGHKEDHYTYHFKEVLRQEATAIKPAPIEEPKDPENKRRRKRVDI